MGHFFEKGMDRSMDECKIDISLGVTFGTDHFEKAILHVARYVT